MSFLELVLMLWVLYYVTYVVLWVLLDCNVFLWYKERLGDPISSMSGKVVWITGASSGIGRALAIKLASNGVRLVLSARRVEQLKDVQHECWLAANKKVEKSDFLVLPMDMLEIQKHEENLQHVLDHFGRLDVLVNNAGRSQRANWEEINVQVDRDLFELDVFSVVHLSRLVVRYFLQKNGGRGHIAATSSVAGLGPVHFSATYCAAKHSLNAYLKCLYLEQPHIDVTLFAPGPIATDFLMEAFTGEPGSKFGKSTKDQKRMTAERCSHLFAVAIANKVTVSWCGLFPINFLAYVMHYPWLALIINHYIGRKTLEKIREGKV